MRDLLHRWATWACLDPACEQLGLLADDSKRKPADVSINGMCGRKVFCDISIGSVLQENSLNNASTTNGFIAKTVEEEKEKKYKEAAAKVGQDACPFVWENFGRRGKKSDHLVKWILQRIASKSGGDYSQTKAFFDGQFSVTLMRCQARTLISHRHRRIMVPDRSCPPFSNPLENCSPLA
jgi:hypothetical protein